MADSGSDSVRSASQEISTEFKTLVHSQDLDSIKQSQNLILGRLQDSNAVLSHFNEYSENCFAEVSADFSRNTRLLRSMKSDLDYIFQKLSGVRVFVVAILCGSGMLYLWLRISSSGVDIWSLKAKIMETYPDAFPDDSAIEALDQRPDLELPR
ncbi:UNVERIFIED_CONTAM: hypothetical protein Slati_1967600 [Sesamum latifolium]|uniref:KxDL domain-containing protein n=1 Tax=Sesamum latifolium TaxID=2727402 RepID=A0AAW2WKR1_9LAMI